MSAVTALEAPPKLQNMGRSEAQNKRGKTHLSMTKKKKEHVSLLLCAFLLLLLPKALICYCVCGQEKLVKCKIPYSLQMPNVDPIISQEYVLSVPVLGYFPPITHLNSLSNCNMYSVYLSFISQAERSLKPSGKKSLIVSIHVTFHSLRTEKTVLKTILLPTGIETMLMFVYYSQ